MMDEHHQEAIVQMMEVTACDEETARQFLSRCAFDVDVAIRNFFDGVLPEATPPPVVPPSFDSPPPSPNEPNPNSRAVLPRYHSLVHFLAQLFILPVKIPIYILSLVYDTFFGRRQNDHGCKTMYEYIDTHLPKYKSRKDKFYEKNLTQLRTEYVAKGWKYVVVYIHEHDGDNAFLINCLESNISRLISEKKSVLYGILSGSEEAKRLRPDRTFGQKRSCAMIYLINGNTLSRKLSIDNLSSPESVNRNITLTLADMLSDEARKEAQRNELLESRRLVQEQNREYEESLQKDLKRIAEKKEQEENARRAILELEEKRRLSEERIKKIEDYKQTLIADSKETEGTGDLLIRFPTGKKVIKFSPDDKLEKLFVEALSSDKCPMFFQMHLSHPKTPVPCLPKWYFDILESEEHEPKKECLDRNLTFEDVNITRGSLIYVDNLGA